MRDRTGERHRVLIVGAGRSGAASHASSTRRRESGSSASSTTTRLRRRRIQGVTVLGGLLEAGTLIAVARPDEVLVTIPDVPASGSTPSSQRAPRPASRADSSAAARDQTPPLVEATGE